MSRRERTRLFNERVNTFLAGGNVLCMKHGEHRDWALRDYNGRRQLRCNLCGNERVKVCAQTDKYRFRFMAMWARNRSRKMKRKRECNIDESHLEFLWQMQRGRCALSGAVFASRAECSMDRIDSNEGYVVGNVQLVLAAVNKMKWNLKEDRFVELCGLIAEHHRRPSPAPFTWIG